MALGIQTAPKVLYFLLSSGGLGPLSIPSRAQGEPILGISAIIASSGLDISLTEAVILHTTTPYTARPVVSVSTFKAIERALGSKVEPIGNHILLSDGSHLTFLSGSVEGIGRGAGIVSLEEEQLVTPSSTAVLRAVIRTSLFRDSFIGDNYHLLITADASLSNKKPAAYAELKGFVW